MEDVLESKDRSSDPLRNYLVTSRAVKRSEVPSTFAHSALLKSNYEKATSFIKVVLVVLIAAILLLFILSRSPSSEGKEAKAKDTKDTGEYQRYSERHSESYGKKEEEKKRYEEKTVETFKYEEVLPPVKKDSKTDQYFNLKWLTLEALREHEDLDVYLDEKIHKEFQPFSFEKEIEISKRKYWKLLNSSEIEQLEWIDSEELIKKIDQFLSSKKDLAVIYENGFNLTNEIIKSIQDYSVCKTGVLSEKDKLTNISLENEKNKMLIKRYQSEIEEMDRLLNSQMTDTQTLLNKYESEKRRLQGLLVEKQKELSKLKQDPDRLMKDLDEIRRLLSEFKNKDKLLIEIQDNSDEIEKIKRRLREIEDEKEDLNSHIDFLNKKLKSHDNLAKVGEDFKSFSSNDAPMILLEKLKNMQKEFQDRPQSRRYMKSRIEDAKREYIDAMHASINGKRHLTHLEDSLSSAYSERRENYKKDLKNLEKEYVELKRRLQELEQEIITKKRQYSEWEKKHEDLKRKGEDKESLLAELAKKVQQLEREIEDLTLQINEKERLIDQIKNQPRVDPALVNANKRDLEEKIRSLQRIVNLKENEFIGILKKMNSNIKQCRGRFAFVHELMKRNNIMDDFKELLEKLLSLKEELRRKMRNYVDNI